MTNLILKKEEDLPAGLQNLTGKNFIPAGHPEIIYIPGTFNVQSLAKIPYYLCAVMSFFAGIFFLYTVVSEIINWHKNTRFRSEGVMITFIMFAFMFGLFLLCRRYLKKSTILQQKINSGEKRFGLWITPGHLLTNDLNEGMRCVAKKEIEHLETYFSGRPQLDMVLVYLHNKQQMRIVADWLSGYYRKSGDLKTLIESKLISGKINTGVIDGFINTLGTPGEKQNRFFLLTSFIEKYTKENGLDTQEKNDLILYVNQKIKNWLPAERLAEESWWVDFTIDDSYVYGVNSATIKEFRGYQKEPYWLMPLAKTAVLDFEMADLIAKRNVDAFIESDCFSRLENLSVAIMISDYCIEKIMASGKFSHLKILDTPSTHFADKNQEKKFEAWKAEHKIKSGG